ncbi:phosphatidylserine/phosphatidylglycerophosphate/cardiolipin synthase family protein [Actinocorallia sp. API 0066]|uniref:phospholipase D-like domain-containing protein n=1 Tax=Actinocorallia sp. API 0066 TaxID=2896846 RepID=UPI001E424823|nr:phosphatidylserine/phosphatidylglycerophosphate/cardiolipin synthase family protein [Actinocorallia sp. API 0066]MCD0451174.1 phosphatidylserine/phosphatidylglycerophosphate/cardiolipin synthase family protein [Actinocorallia sp. API 0066]
MAVVAAGGLVAGVPTAASAAGVKSHIVFNNPLTPKGAKNIENRIQKLVQGARPGSRIRISVYRFSNAHGIADALIAADRRGVDVRIIADKGATRRHAPNYAPTGFERVRDAIGGDKVVTCPETRACIGEKLNHTKFLLFSNVRGTRNIVVQTSQNLNATGGTTTDWNDAVVLANATGTYNAYYRYFGDLWTRKPVPNYWRKRGGEVSSPEAVVQFFPKARRTADPIAKTLRQVKCLYTNNGKARKSHVRITTGNFNNKRAEVLTALTGLARKGCTVEVMLTVDPADGSRTAVIPVLRDAGVKVYDFGEYTSPNPMHSKYILVSGKLGQKVGKWTWTGSANFTYGSLYQDDEAVLQLRKVGKLGPKKIHDTYRCNFVRARAQFLGRPVPRPNCK